MSDPTEPKKPECVNVFAALGRVLYEKMEHLDPGAGKFVEWDELTIRQREFYSLCAEAILRERELVERALHCASDNVILGRAKEGE